MARKKPLIPDDILCPVASEFKESVKIGEETYLDSQVAQIRAQLGAEYAAVPLDWIRTRCGHFRKTPSKYPEYWRANGNAKARKGSRKKAKRKPFPKGYRERLDSPDWKEKLHELKVFWSNRCATCNVSSEEAILDGHHRTYERFRDEDFTDVILLCRRCHDLFHENVKVE